MIGLDAGGGLFLALREPQLTHRLTQVCRHNAARLAPTMPWARGETSADAIAAYGVTTLRRLADGSGLDLAIVRSGEVLGVVNAVVGADGTAEFCWWVDRDVEGTGVARRAVETLAEHLVVRRGVRQVTARTLPGDGRSGRLATRLGMTAIDDIGGARVYALSAERWRDANPRTAVELALPVDDELEMVLAEPRFVPALHAMTVANLDRLRQWEPWAQTRPTAQQSAAWWHGRMELFARAEAYPLLPRRRADPGPALLGSVGATIEPTMGIATVGYWLDAAATGRGVGTRCVGRLVEMLLEERQVEYLGLSTAVHNTRSRALAERCGLTCDALLPAHQRIAGADVDCVAYVRRR